MEDTVQPEPTDTEHVVDLIQQGRIDLAEVTRAVRGVIELSDAVIQWELDCGKIPALAARDLTDTITPDELTLGEQVDVIDATGVGWDTFNPIDDQRHAFHLLIALLTHRAGLDASTAKTTAGAVKAGEFDAAYRLIDKRPVPPT